MSTFYKARTIIVYNSADVEHNSQKCRNNEKNYNDEKCNSYDNYYFCYNTDDDDDDNNDNCNDNNNNNNNKKNNKIQYEIKFKNIS